MVLEGKLFVANRMIDIKEIVYEEKGVRFSVELEHALVLLCRELDIPVPMWMAKTHMSLLLFTKQYFSQNNIPRR